MNVDYTTIYNNLISSIYQNIDYQNQSQVLNAQIEENEISDSYYKGENDFIINHVFHYYENWHSDQIALT